MLRSPLQSLKDEHVQCALHQFNPVPILVLRRHRCRHSTMMHVDCLQHSKGFPDEMIVLKSGDLAPNELSFRDGTIEFDMKPLAEDIPGIRFRQRDHQNGEEFYIRSLPDCRAENDCIQYSPVINGLCFGTSIPSTR